MESCPLCHSQETSLLHCGDQRSGFRDFLHCDSCDLVFVPRRFFLNPDAEKARYLLHNNDTDDPDYRSFLGRLYYALKPFLKRGAKGLDYGAGPGPALLTMMREDGFDARMYDPYFCPDGDALEDSYDFITCTETAEHFRTPDADFERLNALLNRPGWLGVMTAMLDDWAEFPNWYYHRDPTHVCFYSRKTMEWIANHHSWKVSFPRPNVAIFNAV